MVAGAIDANTTLTCRSFTSRSLSISSDIQSVPILAPASAVHAFMPSSEQLPACRHLCHAGQAVLLSHRHS